MLRCMSGWMHQFTALLRADAGGRGSSPMRWLLLRPIRRLFCWLGLHAIEVSRSGDPHSAEGSYAYCRHCPWTRS